ncbi:MAG: glucosaminidase domain-containing protein [Bacteroidales bacterium]|nr:glucosaminidase domain-containing protein [Bacteroidales bacterium]
MKKLLFVLLAAAVFFAASTPQEGYIERYAATAVDEMYHNGIPASITLAQGLIESSAGQSFLAVYANNHFGIKCHRDWKGERVFRDDDAKHECFRKYKTVADSYRDHSDFLRYRDRYKFLFDYGLTDYKSWAYGLKKAGYATDPAYPTKLIGIIERYQLYRYDKMKPGEVRTPDGVVSGKVTPEEAEEVRLGPPSPPQRLEEAQRVDSHDFIFSLERQVYSKNGVPFVYAMEGETYESIAKEFRLFSSEIYRFNDLKKGSRQPAVGEVVYVHAKKTHTARGLDMHIVESSDETLWGIAQRYGVTLKSILKRNGLTANYYLDEGDAIKLR